MSIKQSKEINKEESIEGAKQRINLLVEVLQVSIETAGVVVGIDTIGKKLAFKDVRTGLVATVKLEDLNKVLIEEAE